jgi:hypothetical protein
MARQIALLVLWPQSGLTMGAILEEEKQANKERIISLMT